MLKKRFLIAFAAISTAFFVSTGHADHRNGHGEGGGGDGGGDGHTHDDLQTQINNIQLLPGPQGDPGPAGADAPLFSTYVIRTPTQFASNSNNYLDGVGTAPARCLSLEDSITGGGCDINGVNGGWVVAESSPFTALSGDGWICRFQCIRDTGCINSFNGNTASTVAIAICGQ